jgi:cytochrome oxidase Cu insertion factor (SCO1/SenC/PrrC family)
MRCGGKGRDEMKRRQFLRLAVTSVLCATPGRAGATPAIGKPAPDFSLPLFDGRMVSLKDFRERPVLVNFFNSG